jgi:hypothetical protein
MPESADVHEMTAEIYDHRKSYDIAPISRFTISRRYIALVLDAFRPAKVHDYGDFCERDLTFGVVSITTNDGRTINITFCDTGQGPLGFAVDRIRCMRGGVQRPVVVAGKDESYAAEGYLLYYIIQAIDKIEKTGKDESEVDAYIDKFKRSRGELPPIDWRQEKGRGKDEREEKMSGPAL